MDNSDYLTMSQITEEKVKTKSEHNDNVPLNIRIGIDHELFFFNEYSPGSCFWLPNGTRIYNKLIEFIRDEYFKRGFQEVITPIIAKKDLWEISGHWEKYKEHMFCFDCDDTEYALKGMNCPLHCTIFKHRNRSYHELPLRLADFGSLHRNELRGALTSLFRNRKFCQDDAHIFCTYDQIKQEMHGAIDFLVLVYQKFGFVFKVGLSTRPEKFIGEIEIWNQAEKELTDVLNDSGLEWYVKEGDGAFYGPKIDVHLTDSLGREHQCATIQLDFQLPNRFKLEYVDKDSEYKTPVIIHRAIYGSFERFIAILCEHYNGKWPFWLSPKQVIIIPITNKHLEYAHKVMHELRLSKYYVDIDTTDRKLDKKIREAQIAQYNYMIIVGQKEIDTNTINIRYRNNDNNNKVCSVQDLLKEFDANIKEFKNDV